MGETFVGIQGVNRACQKQHAGETGGQRGRDCGAGPSGNEAEAVGENRSFPMFVSRTAPDSMVPFSFTWAAWQTT